jgi:hypothetical protein
MGIENMDLSPHNNVIEGHGMGYGIKPHYDHMTFVPSGSGLGAGGGSSGSAGGGLYAHPHGGRLSKIGQAFNKAFNPKKNGVEKAINKTIVQPIEHNVIQPVEHAGGQIVNGLKVVGHYVIPATLAGLGGLAGATLGGLATGGAGGEFVGGIAGSALGSYAGNQADKALGIQGNTSFGKGVRRGRPPKGGNIKKELEKVYDKIPHEFHQPLEDLGRAGVEYAGFKLPPRKHERGKGVKGCPSKTRKGDMDYTTKKGDKDYHRGGHEESEPESESDEETGGSVRKRRPHMVKGSVEAKEYMRKLREKRTMKGKGVSNNSPQADHIRVSPYQNF